MTIRTSSKTVTFAHPFLLKAIDRILAAGDYRVVTDEELIEGLSISRLSPRGHYDLSSGGIWQCFYR
jgi:hypothetical protein